MLGFNSIKRILVSTEPTDMRKSFDGLCGCVEQRFQMDPLDSTMFVFFNRKRTMVKMLLWDRYGFWIFAKRLESGTFLFRSVENGSEINTTELLCILDGIDLVHSRRKRRFSIKKT